METDVKEMIEECEDIFMRMKLAEKEANQQIVKYFDRIHDKLFAYQLFFSCWLYFFNSDTFNTNFTLVVDSSF